jgi:hypothetical protein
LRLADQRASGAEDAGIELPDDGDTQVVLPEQSGRGCRSSAGEKPMGTALPDHDSGVLMPGLDGSNPLAFLAALGLFRIVSFSASPQAILTGRHCAS